jgi:hypothetical protein
MTALFAGSDVARLQHHLACIEIGNLGDFGSPSSIHRQTQMETFYQTAIRENSLVVLEKARTCSDAADSEMLTVAMELDRADRCKAIILNGTHSVPTAQVESNGAAINALSTQLTAAYNARTAILDLATKNWYRATAINFPTGKQVRMNGMKTAKWNGCTGTIEANATCAPGRLAVRTSATKTLVSVDFVHLTHV